VLSVEGAGRPAVHVDGALAAGVQGQDDALALGLGREGDGGSEPAVLELGPPARAGRHRLELPFQGFLGRELVVGGKAFKLHVGERAMDAVAEHAAPVVEAHAPFMRESHVVVPSGAVDCRAGGSRTKAAGEGHVARRRCSALNAPLYPPPRTSSRSGGSDRTVQHC
jgi:hypothetical protein